MRCIDWADGAVVLIDQTALPDEERWLRITDPDELVDAIRRLAVRGAPALGAAGALGVALAAHNAAARTSAPQAPKPSASPAAEPSGLPAAGASAPSNAGTSAPPSTSRHGVAGLEAAGRGPGHRQEAFSGAGAARGQMAEAPGAESRWPGAYEQDVRAAAARLREARPTAVNLARGVDRALGRVADGPEAVVAEARAVLEEEADACRAIGERGAGLLQQDRPLRILTHCNTGWLAAVEWGTALGIVTVLDERDQVQRVYVDETRPLLQGVRLTAWELAARGIDYRVVADGAAPSVIARGMVDAVVVGADRIAANGDVANKVGTYPLALAAARAGIPFVVAAPESTVDIETPTGADIEIEERDPSEVADGPAYNPAFDVTPADLVTAVVTERRTVRPSRGETL
jgi:methylthioribose-1-phosphate isomerase